MNNYQINFKANFIKYVDVEKKAKRHYIPYKVSLVELSKDDLPALRKTSSIWNAQFSDNIVSDLSSIGNYKITDATNIYALTTQQNNFKKLKSEKILGLIDITNMLRSNFVVVNFLQVRPRYMYPFYGKQSFIEKFVVNTFFPKPKFKHIGQVLIDHVHQKFSNKDIQLQAVNDAIDFYLKQGFRNISNFSNYMQLNRKI